MEGVFKYGEEGELSLRYYIQVHRSLTDTMPTE